MDKSLLAQFQCTGDQVRIAYELIFEQPMRTAVEAEGDKPAISEMTYEEALKEMVEKYGFRAIHEVVHAVLQDQYVQEPVPGRVAANGKPLTKAVWKTYTEEEKRASVEELVNNL